MPYAFPVTAIAIIAIAIAIAVVNLTVHRPPPTRPSEIHLFQT
jgi:hypothetical protein